VTASHTVRTRRAILASAAAAAGALAVQAATRPLTTEADNGQNIILGSTTNTATAESRMTSSGPQATFRADNTASTGGWGLEGRSTSAGQSAGVIGQASGVGGSGVYGVSLANSGTGIGVNAGASSPSGAAVAASCVPGGTGVAGLVGAPMAWAANTGVYGYAPAGTGVYARSDTGIGLKVVGKARYNRAGKATVSAGKTSVDVTVAGGIASNTIITATLQAYRTGVSIAGVRPNYPSAGKARIYLTKAPTTSTAVGWVASEYGA
jgi:hypothetical protein